MQNNIMSTICRKTKTGPDEVKVRHEGVMWRCEEEVRSMLSCNTYSEIPVNLLGNSADASKSGLDAGLPTGKESRVHVPANHVRFGGRQALTLSAGESSWAKNSSPEEEGDELEKTAA
ncbi:hypothetical protein GBF38_011918 [Nibea albiflora]|uniref:Uncharacterized protein n=1 Tax=Nibea albiflora TaxID=240163 RepID=A0ACB7F591_NIBAL|nr:hypothetical protein GBF38_011918 [Nibea albiflora]